MKTFEKKEKKGQGTGNSVAPLTQACVAHLWRFRWYTQGYGERNVLGPT